MKFSDISVLEVVVAVAGTGSLATFVWLIARPAWSAYSTRWERLAALFLSLYVLVAFVIVGVAVGFAVLWSSNL